MELRRFFNRQAIFKFQHEHKFIPHDVRKYKAIEDKSWNMTLIIIDNINKNLLKQTGYNDEKNNKSNSYNYKLKRILIRIVEKEIVTSRKNKK